VAKVLVGGEGCSPNEPTAVPQFSFLFPLARDTRTRRSAATISVSYPSVFVSRLRIVPPDIIRARIFVAIDVGSGMTTSTDVSGCRRCLARNTIPDLLTQFVVASCQSRSPLLRNCIGICSRNLRARRTNLRPLSWAPDIGTVDCHEFADILEISDCKDQPPVNRLHSSRAAGRTGQHSRYHSPEPSLDRAAQVLSQVNICFGFRGLNGYLCLALRSRFSDSSQAKSLVRALSLTRKSMRETWISARRFERHTSAHPHPHLMTGGARMQSALRFGIREELGRVSGPCKGIHD
jgi:hypothetical protein